MRHIRLCFSPKYTWKKLIKILSVILSMVEHEQCFFSVYICMCGVCGVPDFHKD